MVTVIPIDNDRAAQKLPIHIETVPDAFPERFQIRLEWNFIEEKWVFEVIHKEIEERVVKNLATPYFPYWYDPYILFAFLDPSGEAMEVTPDNLGDDIELYAYPGPGGQEG